jgi:hypothetical protein
MKKILLFVVFLTLVTNTFGQKRQKFSAGAEIAAIDTIANTLPFDSVLFVYQGSSHLVNYYQDFTKKLQKAFRKSDLTLGFDFDLDTQKGLEEDIKALPKRVQNPASFDLICHVNLKYMKGWDNDLLKKRKQSYVVLLELFQKNQLRKRIAITVRTYWMISTQNKAVSELIFDEMKD